MAKSTKAAQAARAGSLGAGTAKHFTNPAQVLTFGGSSQTVADVLTRLGLVGSLRKDTEASQATAAAKVAAEDTQLPALTAFMGDYTSFVKATFGNAPDVLADFDIASKKAPSKPDAETQLAAVAKRKATRQARGTRGSQQKKAIKGNVTGVVVTPIVVSAAPSPQPAAAGMASAMVAPSAPAAGAAVQGGGAGGVTPSK
ncbi:MAG TPA: hypothetical protein VGG39_16140 [Polyangiaceae bacterium]|jgi:hypothetical protein